MLTWPARPADGILDAMDLASRALVMLGFVAGAVIGAMTVAAVLIVAGGGVDVHGHASQLLLAAGGAGGAALGARVNRASGRALLTERAADLA